MSQQQNKKYKEQQMKILALKNTITKIKKIKKQDQWRKWEKMVNWNTDQKLPISEHT